MVAVLSTWPSVCGLPSSTLPLSVIIPARDEAAALPGLLTEVRLALAGGPRYELIVVDDGSRDSTLTTLQPLVESMPELRVLSHTHPAGQSAAIRTGARAARGQWLATLDGDGQNDPADLCNLWALACAAQPPALIMGRRMARHDHAVRRVSSRIANGVRAAVLGDHCRDSGCGIKLIPRTVYHQLPYFDHMHRFMPALVAREGGRVTSVPVHHRPRRAGRSKYGIGNRLWAGLVDLLGVLWLQRRMAPVAVEEMRP